MSRTPELHRSTRPSNKLETVIQQNASAAEEMASTSEELSGQSSELERVMAFFKLDGNGGGMQYDGQVKAVAPPQAPA